MRPVFARFSEPVWSGHAPSWADFITTTPELKFSVHTAGLRSFRDGRGELRQRLTATLAAFRRNRTARNRHQAAKARDDMRSWQVERRKRTRHLVELGGLVVKAGIVDLTDDDRATILGALLWMADRLKSDQSEHARALWTAKGKQAFEADTATHRG